MGAAASAGPEGKEKEKKLKGVFHKKDHKEVKKPALKFKKAYEEIRKSGMQQLLPHVQSVYAVPGGNGFAARPCGTPICLCPSAFP